MTSTPGTQPSGAASVLRTDNGTPEASQALLGPVERRDGASTADTSPVAELRAVENEIARQRIAELEAEVEQLTEVSRRLLDQRQEMAEERFAWQERGDNAEARVRELEAERAKYVGAEPTIAEEMAYLSRCFFAVHAVCDEAERQASRWEHPLPVPEWVATVRAAASGERDTAPLALPWAHAMDDGDLHEFLNDLVSAALNRWRTGPDGPVPDRDTLADIEKACAVWRHPGRGCRSDEPEAP